MSQQTKDRTLIGTVAPIPVRPVRTTEATQATIIAESSGPIGSPSQPAAATPNQAEPTITMRPGQPEVILPHGVDEPDIFIGQELGGYAIRRKLAEGGMGVVYEGVHSKIGRLGAIKVLKLELCSSEQIVERFYQEARAVNAIHHENIVDIYDFGRDPYGRVFFVMEFLQGEPLSSRIRRGPLAWHEALPILDQTLRALKAAHDKGFVHRDLKPDNIWLRYVDGRIQVKLLDFGIAKLIGSNSPAEKLTRTGSIIGTPHYMSPEQINGSRDIDHRTDIYALGVITYELFAGRTPFGGETMQAVMTGHLFQEAPKLVDLPVNLGVPAPLAELVDRMLVKDPAGRYASVSDVLADLRDVSEHRMPAKADTLRREQPTRLLAPPVAPAPAKRRRALPFVLGGLAVVAVVAGLAIWNSTQSVPEAPPVPARVTPVVVPTKTAPPVERPLDYDALRKDAQTTLRASLRETEPVARVQGSDALGKIHDQPSTPALTALTAQDADAEVRGHAAAALGAIGATDTARLLGKLETAAPPPLKVWYASALARLGDKAARNRLLGYARNKDLAVAFPAGLTLADLSQPGDRNTLSALRALAAHEAELNSVAPYAGALILTKMAKLHDATARKLLYGILGNDAEGARLAAAEGLARLGDDAGKQVLSAVAGDQASPNRLVAAVAQIALGDYSGLDQITEALDGKDPEARRLAARALGDIGERKSVKPLLALVSDRDWTVRIAAAAAIVAIVGLDPVVLAQASIDWTKGALASQDWAVRKAAAGVLADIPEKEAVPLLAQAIADPDPAVRLAASRSAGKMKTAEAAIKVAAAATAEADPQVKEQEVVALGKIGNPAAHDALAQISDEPGRIGVLAAGSLIAVGDTAGEAKLERAVADPRVDLRLAAVQAASAAGNPIVVPTLVLGIADRIFDVRFTAAEGLAMLHAEKATAVPVLRAAAESKDNTIVGRAIAALATLGEAINQLRNPADLLDSTDPKDRLAAIPIVRALAPGDAAPLLRRLVGDADPEVRRAGVDAIEVVAARDKGEAIKLYKPLVSDGDQMVSSKAAGQLSRLVPPPPKTASVQPAAAPVPAAAPPPQVKLAVDDATAAAAEAKAGADAFDALAGELTTATAAPPHDDTTIKRVEELAGKLEEADRQLSAAADKAEAAAKAAADAAGASPAADVAQLVEQSRALAREARDRATAVHGKATAAAEDARRYVKQETDDAQMLINAADAALAARNTTDAKHNLDRAAEILRRTSGKNAGLDYSYAQLYDLMAGRSQDQAAKRTLLKQAQDAYARYAKAGAGPRVQRARDRASEIADEIKALE